MTDVFFRQDSGFRLGWMVRQESCNYKCESDIPKNIFKG